MSVVLACIIELPVISVPVTRVGRPGSASTVGSTDPLSQQQIAFDVASIFGNTAPVTRVGRPGCVFQLLAALTYQRGWEA